jgi:rhamnosyltransferase
MMEQPKAGSDKPLGPSHRIAVAIPTLNAANHWATLVSGLLRQTAIIDEILIVDSESTDGTRVLAESAGFRVLPILRSHFNHGGTRQQAADALSNSDIVVYLTQDVDLENSMSIERLVEPFLDPKVGAVYGRQLPRVGAHPIEEHARLFNYPKTGGIRTLEDRKTLGIRAAFFSNSFSAYRRSALLEVGGFPTDTIMAEDTLVAARMLIGGWKTVYAAEAVVVHSHPYSITQEFQRYFDTGVYHRREPWLLEQFGSAGSEGLRFVRSEIKHLGWRHWYLVPSSVARTFAKLFAYYLGRREDKLPLNTRRVLSMHKSFWTLENGSISPHQNPKPQSEV